MEQENVPPTADPVRLDAVRPLGLLEIICAIAFLGCAFSIAAGTPMSKTGRQVEFAALLAGLGLFGLHSAALAAFTKHRHAVVVGSLIGTIVWTSSILVVIARVPFRHPAWYIGLIATAITAVLVGARCAPAGRAAASASILVGSLMTLIMWGTRSSGASS